MFKNTRYVSIFQTFSSSMKSNRLYSKTDCNNPDWWKPKANKMTEVILQHESYAKSYEKDTSDPISAEVQEAFRNTPRHNFVPDELQDQAYEDTPLPIGSQQTISQPYIVALMTQLLNVKKGDKVLEIGTGSGYQAAIQSKLGVEVYSIEIQKPLYEELKGKFVGWDGVNQKYADGYHGWEEAQPFDSVMITCAAKQEVPPPIFSQLKEGGYVVVPIEHSVGNQVLYQSKKVGNDLKNKEIIGVRFVPFTRKNI